MSSGWWCTNMESWPTTRQINATRCESPPINLVNYHFAFREFVAIQRDASSGVLMAYMLSNGAMASFALTVMLKYCCSAC